MSLYYEYKQSYSLVYYGTFARKNGCTTIKYRCTHLIAMCKQGRTLEELLCSKEVAAIRYPYALVVWHQRCRTGIMDIL